ncbi:heterokaryon incompatibility protein-domain-containing protein [Pseudomassariella vexata]|uniref:Heterokaryon incompatibility protein-domain-containing protein n=1 Tax=Pseudomassariella vexata TaxID=1141098 RepID=A0A1Y2DTX6_9PEZI|nr:heterokaryon incompatibility protein-domain-containing protein [Pseudomassariella vexata]ORY62085.1 heterokaryon incompatibility protein-domain-containing protein [Pseudomassariella vexata]
MPLCGSCADIKLDDLLTATVRPFKATWAELTDSIAKCEFCALFLAECKLDSQVHGSNESLYVAGSCNMVQEKYGQYSIQNIINLHLYAGVPNALDTSDHSNSVRVGNVRDMKDRGLRQFGSLPVTCDRDAPSQTADRIHNRLVHPADDPACVRQWLSTCLSDHSACATGFGRQYSDVPTRLLDIGNISAGIPPSFVETNDTIVDYIALSHRWGGVNITRTTSGNLRKHKEAIPTDTLNNTFRDAIAVTAALGFRYICIDSLCIIQDSREDWEREASRMAQVYQNAILTISAACETSGDTGLFQTRETPTMVNLPQYDAFNGSGSLAVYIISNQSFTSPIALGSSRFRHLGPFDTEVSSGPLNTRAWTLQERYLSRRIIHFGCKQLFWECQTSTGEESSIRDPMPLDRFGATEKDHTNGFLKCLSSQPLVEETPGYGGSTHRSAPTYAIWYKLVSDYGGRDLTVDTDKLPAISGITRVFAYYSQDEYLAGLWRRDIPTGLLWHASEWGKPLRRPRAYRAPSWSWASRDGPVLIEAEWRGQVEISDVVAFTQTAGFDMYGEVKSGYLKLSGYLE